MLEKCHQSPSICIEPLSVSTEEKLEMKSNAKLIFQVLWYWQTFQLSAGISFFFEENSLLGAQQYKMLQEESLRKKAATSEGKGRGQRQAARPAARPAAGDAASDPQRVRAGGGARIRGSGNRRMGWGSGGLGLERPMVRLEKLR
ncbi:unnamed protein product [Urochloa humidicola]